MEEAAELGSYLPISFKTTSEQEYIAFLWDAFETNFIHGTYPLACSAGVSPASSERGETPVTVHGLRSRQRREQRSSVFRAPRALAIPAWGNAPGPRIKWKGKGQRPVPSDRESQACSAVASPDKKG